MAITEIKSVTTETAMLKLIPQDQLNMEYVDKWKTFALKALRSGKLKPISMTSHTAVLYHAPKSNTSGVWFASIDGLNVAYLYAYQSLSIRRKRHAAEALAYLFNPTVRGLTREVFFEHLLPHSKFVVTDSIYTDDGKRWLEAEYMFALANPSRYKVYSIDLSKGKFELLAEPAVFWERYPSYWGKTSKYQKYRFAIESLA